MKLCSPTRPSPSAHGSRYRFSPAYRLGTLIALALVTVPGWAHGRDSIQPEALRQIAVLTAEKASRTPAQQKIDSRLVRELRRQRGEAGLAQLDLRDRVVPADDGRIVLDITARVDAALLQEVADLGGEIVSAFPHFEAVRAMLPLTAVERLAASAAVRWVRPADPYLVQGGINVTEGDVAHGADAGRVNFGIDGTGVQVGAMSDSVDALASLQGSGDLPPVVTVLAGQSGNPGSSEGTALLEIIFDMAPGADLFFATGRGGQAQMAQNILDLAAAGCDVIVDDVLYLTEPVFQDGIIAQAVDTVAAAGVLYFTSAGNSGNLAAGTSGVFEGDYSGIALPAPVVGLGLSAHDFGGGDSSNIITEQALNDAAAFTLQWADPQGAADNDYDLYLLDAALANVLDASTNTQNGTQNPVELIDSQGQDDSGNRLVVVKFAGDDRFLHLNTHRGLLEHATDGQIFGHPAAEGALSVAAVNVATAAGAPFTGGPANPAEPFTSDGPRRIFFQANGTPVDAPGDGGQTSIVREKPDVAAADGVSTATPGFNPFFGTSASAPHTAAIGALYSELFPDIPFDDAFDAFRTSALDIEDPGFDNVSGNGILMMEPAVTNIFADGFESGDATAWTDQAP